MRRWSCWRRALTTDRPSDHWMVRRRSAISAPESAQVGGGPAGGGGMAVLHGVERLGQVRRDALAGDVVQLVRVGGGVVVLLLAIVVPHIQRVRGADRLVAGRITLLIVLPVRVRRAVVRAVMLDQNGLPPTGRVLPVP